MVDWLVVNGLVVDGFMMHVGPVVARLAVFMLFVVVRVGIR